MSELNKDTFTILNYQGSKKNLLSFINDNIKGYIDEKKAILDICCGTASVAYSLKRNNIVYANDSELYATVIAKALLQFNNDNGLWTKIEADFCKLYKENYNELIKIFYSYYQSEEEAINLNDYKMIRKLYDNFPSIWSEKSFKCFGNTISTINDINKYKESIPYMLFTTYYSTTYFGIKQSMEIDSIRYAIEKIDNEDMRYMMLSSLYYAMKECIFSKDGHMAQPLDINNNFKKIFKVRNKSIYDAFKNKIIEFNKESFVVNKNENKVFNMEMMDIIKLDEIKNNVGFIYADPPYTDMQYSRYYHLLNTVTLYDYDNISLNRGKLSKGLYREKRFQSPLSQRSKAKEQIEALFKFCKDNKINLGFSFAYPRDPEKQAVNRYTMSIDAIIDLAMVTFGIDNVQILTEEYEHSNNRNMDTKKVLEYLILCKSKELN